LLRKLLKKQGLAPTRITTDKLKWYPVAIRDERLYAMHDQGTARTTVPKTHTNPFGSANESSNGSSPRDRPGASCRSTPPSTRPSTSNAPFCRAVSLNRFALTRSRFGSRAGLALDPDLHRTLDAAPVDVSKPTDVNKDVNNEGGYSPV
jgi:hypothetical protein